MEDMNLIFLDASQTRWRDILGEHKEEARQRALSLVAEGNRTDDGCIVTPTKAIRKVRFRGNQYPAYRFIYCALNEIAPSFEQVVRHRCHNRRCINPDHLTIGSRADNKQDDWDYQANGLDMAFL